MSDKEQVDKTINSVTMATAKWLGLLRSEAFTKCLLAGFSSAILTRKFGKLRSKLEEFQKEHLAQVEGLQKEFFQVDEKTEEFKTEKVTQVYINDVGEKAEKEVQVLCPINTEKEVEYRKLIEELEAERLEIKFAPFDFKMLDAGSFRNQKVYFTQIDHEILGDLVIDDLEEL